MKKALLLLITFFSIYSYSQQIGDGYAPIVTDFNSPLQSGVYNGNDPIGSISNTGLGWQHLFVIRHPNPTNNYQLQIASSIGINDNIFFRKISKAGLQPTSSPWIELATRGTNNFIGDQNIEGNLGVGTTAPASKLTIRSGTTGVSIHPGLNPYFGTLAFNRESFTGAIFDPNGQAFQINNGGGDKNLHFQIYNGDGTLVTNDALVINGADGNIGIGTSKTTSKLTVAGDINSREVRVTVNAGADFVFEDNYNLTPLDSLENYIKENKHLPEIASAKEMQINGINLSEMNIKLLQKIEEMTLYMIEQNKKLETQNIEIQLQNQRILSLEKR